MEADLTAAPPDTLLVASVTPVGYVLGGMLWWFLISTVAVFVLLALVEWRRARAQGRRWPWD